MKTPVLRTLHVVLEIEVSSPNHCSNNCRFMVTGSVGVCALGGDFETVELEWDRRKRAHGYKRSSACKHAELPAKRRAPQT